MHQHRIFWYAKDARSPEQYQDAYAVDPRKGSFAIADGVSSSLFAGSWAKLVTQACAAEPPTVRDAAAVKHWLDRLRQRWLAPIDVKALSWHQKPKFKEGAATTLLWVRLLPVNEADGGPPRAYRMYAYAIGDCTLFHVSGGQVQRAFPFEDSRLFEAKPHVLRSVELPNAAALSFDSLEDGCEPGDLLVLATDALALWALQELEAGRSPGFEAFWTMNEEAFATKVQSLREAGAIRVDDTTLMLVRV
jgi:hypothetical protein